MKINKYLRSGLCLEELSKEIKEKDILTLYYYNKASNNEQLEDIIEDINKKGILSKAYDIFDKYKIDKIEEIKTINNYDFNIVLQQEKPDLNYLEFYVKINLPREKVKKVYNLLTDSYIYIVKKYIPKKYISEIKAKFLSNS